MIILWIYLIGIIAIPLIFGYFNRHYKWITKSDIDADLMPLVIFGIALWPLAIFMAIIAGMFFGYKKYFIPD